jgi:Domain of unknown function (DUF4194)
MPKSWDEISRKDELHDPIEFKNAMYQLITSQSLCVRNNDQAKAYQLISDYFEAFKEAVALMGLRLGINVRFGYCYVIEEDVKTKLLSIEETRFILMLRKMYDALSSRGEREITGEVNLSIVEFETNYDETIGQKLNKVNLKQMLSYTKKMGIAMAAENQDEKVFNDAQPFYIKIMPFIVDSISTAAIEKFVQSIRYSTNKQENE